MNGYYNRTLNEFANSSPIVVPTGLEFIQRQDNTNKCWGWDDELYSVEIADVPMGAFIKANNGSTYIVVARGDLRRWHFTS